MSTSLFNSKKEWEDNAFANALSPKAMPERQNCEIIMVDAKISIEELMTTMMRIEKKVNRILIQLGIDDKSEILIV